MSEKSLKVIGVMIDAEHKDFSIYQLSGQYSENDQEGTFQCISSGSSKFGKGLNNYLSYISKITSATTQFVIVYDVSCQNKEEHIKKLLTEINAIKNNDLLPTLISIGHELQPFAEEITNQVLVKEASDIGIRKELFKNIIMNEFLNTEKIFVSAHQALQPQNNLIQDMPETPKVKPSLAKETPTSLPMNISMMVLGGVIAAAGITAVAIAFTLLNAATFGVSGLVAAVVGAAAALSGVGLFAIGAYKNRQTSSDEPLNNVGNFAH
jgi:hypothetical protein